jgi:hypothetical protein
MEPVLIATSLVEIATDLNLINVFLVPQPEFCKNQNVSINVLKDISIILLLKNVTSVLLKHFFVLVSQHTLFVVNNSSLKINFVSKIVDLATMLK